jgi:hypothetical protein
VERGGWDAHRDLVAGREIRPLTVQLHHHAVVRNAQCDARAAAEEHAFLDDSDTPVRQSRIGVLDLDLFRADTEVAPLPASTALVNAAVTRFMRPTNPATNALAGRSYRSAPLPTCATRPASITTIRSATSIASCWS